MKTSIKKIKNHDFSEAHRYFLFTDGSLREKDKDDPLMGLGAHLRDAAGKKVLFYSEQLRVSELPAPFKKEKFEELALFRAMTICLKQGIRRLVVQSDSSGMVDKITQYIQCKEVRGIESLESFAYKNESFAPIFELIHSFHEVFAEHIPRNANKEADFYSRFRFETSLPADYSEDPSKNYSAAVTETQLVVRRMKNQLDERFFKNRHKTLMLLPEHNSRNSVRWLFEIQDNSLERRYEVRILRKTLGRPYDRNFALVHAPYHAKNKCLVLLFLALNLATCQSSIELVRPCPSGSTEILLLNYNDRFWRTFSDLPVEQSIETDRLFMVSVKTMEDMVDNQFFNFSSVINPDDLVWLDKVAFHPKASFPLRITHGGEAESFRTLPDAVGRRIKSK